MIVIPDLTRTTILVDVSICPGSALSPTCTSAHLRMLKTRKVRGCAQRLLEILEDPGFYVFGVPGSSSISPKGAGVGIVGESRPRRPELGQDLEVARFQPCWARRVLMFMLSALTFTAFRRV